MTLFLLDFRQPSAGGRVAKVPTLWTEEGKLVTGPGELVGFGRAFPDLTLLVHGFNVSRNDGIVAYRAFEKRLGKRAGPSCLLGVLWPGNSSVIGPLSYPWEEGAADGTARALADVLERSLRPRRLSIVAHSLGCRVTLGALGALTTLAADQVALLAGAVDADALARSDRYRASLDRVRRAVVVSSTKDKVLEWAFPAGDFVASLLHGGYTKCALGRCGPQPSRTQSVPSSARGFPLPDTDGIDHGDYLSPDANSAKAQRIAEVVVDVLEGAIP